MHTFINNWRHFVVRGYEECNQFELANEDGNIGLKVPLV